MWKRPWGFGEGLSVCCGLVVIGLAMQFTSGSVVWDNLASPLNVILLVAYIALLCLAFALRRRIYFIRWAMTYHAAVPSIGAVAVMTLLMGLITQTPEADNPLRRMLSFPPFVLVYIWMSCILGLTAIKGITAFKLRKLPSTLNHIGLFTALVCATLGSADMQRLTMNASLGKPEWRATDSAGRLHELPLAIELEEFAIDEYPPKLMVIDNATGMALPEGRPEHLTLDGQDCIGDIHGWHVSVSELIEYAASAASADTIRYVEWRSVGATNAAYIVAANPLNGEEHEGWVSCGSSLFPYQSLRLDSLTSMVMPDREPRKFTSKVKIYTESGLTMETEIEVNKPADIEGWKIYQLNYDQSKGRWSDVSVFELVRDPWLPYVYAGIFIMIAGAVSMFVTAGRTRKEGSR